MGVLYVVATPIGNLSDISERAIQTLSSVDFIAAEDTRNSGILLNRLEIKKPLVSYHKFNEKERASSIIDRILNGENCALVTDAGTPCISDPGAVLVRECAEAGISVVGIPGASAVVLALSVSGFDVKDFAFYGFFPRTKGERAEFLKKISDDSVTTAVVYESPKRIEESLESIVEALPEVKVCVCNDLTKKFERIYRGEARAVLDEIKRNEKSELGEYAVVIHMCEKVKEQNSGVEVSLEARIFDKVYEGLDVKSAVKELQSEGVSRNDAYQAGLNVKNMIK